MTAPRNAGEPGGEYCDPPRATPARRFYSRPGAGTLPPPGCDEASHPRWGRHRLDVFSELWLYGLIGVDAVAGLLALIGAAGGWEVAVFLLMSAGWLAYLTVTRDG